MALDPAIEERARQIREGWNDDTYWARSHGRRKYESDLEGKIVRRLTRRVAIQRVHNIPTRKLWAPGGLDEDGPAWDDVVRCLDE